MNNLFTAYLQEIGRAGRDGRESLALLYFNMNDIGAPHVKCEVKNFVCSTHVAESISRNILASLLKKLIYVINVAIYAKFLAHAILV